MNKKILFVDDEEKILHGLQRSLYSLKDQYDLFFELSGRDGLDLLSKEKIDVVVTDMRMPEMNGLQFLEKVREKHPEVVRIILSGFSDRDMILKSIELAHQYLSKPCDIEVLKNAINKAFEIREILKQENLRALLSRLVNIPSMPNLYLKLLGELEKEIISIENVSKIIASDIGMSVKILQIVNSHFFGVKKGITNIEEAVKILGLDVIKSLVLSLNIFDKFNQELISEFSIKELLDHSVFCAKIAKQIAIFEKKDNIFINNSFLAGMLHDIGILILAANLPEKIKEIYKIVNEEKMIFSTAEKKVLNATHSEVGAYLTKLWGLPDDITDAISFHHNPLASPNKEFSVLTIVHFANYFYFEKFSDNKRENDFFKEELNINYMNKLNLKQKIEEWRNLTIND